MNIILEIVWWLTRIFDNIAMREQTYLQERKQIRSSSEVNNT